MCVRVQTMGERLELKKIIIVCSNLILESVDISHQVVVHLHQIGKLNRTVDTDSCSDQTCADDPDEYRNQRGKAFVTQIFP